jgi:hypothetical protein
MGGHLLMSRKELQRKSVLELVANKHITLQEASQRMMLSYRQTLRVYSRFCAEGDSGLVHGNRGKPSNRAYSASFRKKVISRYRKRYKPHDLGPTLAAEKLAQDGLEVDHETLRRWLCAEGDWYKRRKRKVHRTRRERRGHFGELVQMDGSHHNWFGRDYEKACLMNLVDDATGVTMGSMGHQETTAAAMILLWRWIEKYGVPLALYCDKKNVYLTTREPTLEEQLACQKPQTAFGRACEKLDIRIIAAHSPQAKGRVERSNGTYQDRLVKELSLRGIKTIGTTDQLLQDSFCDELNTKFSVPPLKEKDFHRSIPKGLRLEDVFSYEEHRTVQNDWVISHNSTHYQILKTKREMPMPKDKVLVRTRLDGSVHLLFKQKELKFRQLKKRELELRMERSTTRPTKASKGTSMPQMARKPQADHPWNR